MEQKEPDFEPENERGTLQDEVIAANLPEEPETEVSTDSASLAGPVFSADPERTADTVPTDDEELTVDTVPADDEDLTVDTVLTDDAEPTADAVPTDDEDLTVDTVLTDDAEPTAEPKTVDDPSCIDEYPDPDFEVEIEHGYCDICEKEVDFRIDGEFLRNHFVCSECKSLPRQRAFLHALKMCRPDWRTACMHESSPGGPSSDFLYRHAKNYSISHYYPELESGEMGPEGAICEDLEKLSYPDNVFDVFITQDVMEHIFDVSAAFNEVKRVLKPGGFFLFTVPYYKNLPKTFCRAKRLSDGSIRLYSKAVYHGNPVDEKGALVTWDYGRDFPEFVSRMCGLHPVILRMESRYHGLDGEMMEVFMMRKPRIKTDPSELIPPAFVFPEPPSEDQPDWSPFIEIHPPDEEKKCEEEDINAAGEESAAAQAETPAAESEPAEESAAAQAETPVSESEPAEESAAVPQAETPAAESEPAEESAPAPQAETPAAESEPAEESAPAQAETPAAESEPAEESISDSEVSAECSVAATDVFPSRNQ